VIVPGVDIGEHLSVVGSEAAGTTQIKFMMNGVVCVGSRDATNMAIANAVGPENIFIFDKGKTKSDRAFNAIRFLES